MPRTVITIGPKDHGRRMSLAEFDHAEGQPGYCYELRQGVVTVVNVPHPRHLAQVLSARRQIIAYELENPGRIFGVASGNECKILLPDLESERHPNFVVYKTAPPQGKNVWAKWIPEIVIEVVSPGSEDRDYQQKREEYLQFGVREYWILDAGKHEMLVLRQSGNHWTERRISPPEKYRTRLLAGFEFDCGQVFSAAQGADN